MNKGIEKEEKKEILEDKISSEISSEIVLICPDCRVQCFNIRIVKRSDGNYWTDDVCWRCGAQLPIARIHHK